MSDHEDLDYATMAVHAGLDREPGGPVGLPIHQSVAFELRDLEHGEAVFVRGEGLSYSRVQNPTNAALEARVAALENAAGAVVTSTGNAATLLSLLTLARAGDHVVATTSLFGGTVGLLNQVLPNFGIQSTLTANEPDAIRHAIRDNTRAIIVETIGNPALDVPDLDAIAGHARAARVPLIVDNTWGGVGALCRPLEHGASIVTHSLTKWAGGHGAVLGGAVAAASDLDLAANPIFTEPDRDGKSILERRGANAFLWRARMLGLQQMGLTQNPIASWMLFQGLETLALRLERECRTALDVARWLEGEAGVAWVSYPGLESHSSHANARKYLRGGAGAVLTFGVAGGLDGASRFMKALSLVRRAANLGDNRTLAVHPWTTTHGRLPVAARTAAGVSPEMIRVAFGLESAEDLKRDLRAALDAAAPDAALDSPAGRS